MIKTTVIIVGGGPAGAACAWRLKQANVDTILLDQQKFPRMKPCAGWISPPILSDLEFLPSDYPYGLTTFSQFRVSIRGFQFTLPARQYAIRRFEFDDWLLQRAGVAVEQHTVTNICPSEGGYDVDGKYFGKYLVGAGGTYCPVYRTIFHALSPRSRESLIVAQEEEFAFNYTDTQCRLWFLEHGLPGYAWYVPKSNGYLNVGVGGRAEALKHRRDHLKRHWQMLVEHLERMGLVKGHAFHPVGHTYYVRQKTMIVRNQNAFITGDAASLATLDMGEGIGPAIQSGLRAAEAIIQGSAYSLDSIPRYSFWSILKSRFA